MDLKYFNIEEQVTLNLLYIIIYWIQVRTGYNMKKSF